MTPKEQSVLLYILEFKQNHEIVPSPTQIAVRFGFSRIRAHQYIQSLIGQNKLKAEPKVEVRNYSLCE